jgi:hypothetical protein
MRSSRQTTLQNGNGERSFQALRYDAESLDMRDKHATADADDADFAKLLIFPECAGADSDAMAERLNPERQRRRRFMII